MQELVGNMSIYCSEKKGKIRGKKKIKSELMGRRILEVICELLNNYY